MEKTASRAFRLVGLAIIAVIGLPQIAEVVAGLRENPPAGTPSWGPGMVGGFALVFTAAFAYSFWAVTRDRQSPPRWAPLLFAVQVFAGVSLSPELLHVTAAEVGYVLDRKPAWRWLFGLNLLSLAWSVAAWIAGDFEPMTGIAHLPKLAQAAITTVNVMGWNCFAFAAGRVILAERREREELARVNAELQATRGLLEHTSRLRERLSIARDLHDTLGHHLTALAVNLDLASRVHADECREIVKKSHLVSKLLLNEVRETVSSLRQASSPDVADAIRALAANIPWPQVHLDLDDQADPADPERAQILIRCAQEGMTNAIRHSGAGQLWITLARAGEAIRLEIRDDGHGGAGIAMGSGLRGMRERVESAGGTCEIDPAPPGGGFRLTALLPRPVETAA